MKTQNNDSCSIAAEFSLNALKILIESEFTINIIVTVHRRGRKGRGGTKGKGELLHNFPFILYHNLHDLRVLCGGVNCYI